MKTTLGVAVILGGLSLGRMRRKAAMDTTQSTPPPPLQSEARFAAPGPGLRLDRRLLGLSGRKLFLGRRHLGTASTSAGQMGTRTLGNAAVGRYYYRDGRLALNDSLRRKLAARYCRPRVWVFLFSFRRMLCHGFKPG